MKNEFLPLILLGSDASSRFFEPLRRLGLFPLVLPSDKRLPSPIASHADMLVFIIDNVLFCNEEYYFNNESLFKKIAEYGYLINYSAFAVGNNYPQDIALNQALIGKYILGKKDACAKAILEYTNNNEYEYLSVKQGYAKCSTLVLNKNAIISADDSILKASKDIGLNFLKINNSSVSIKLNGYGYGFVGGASFVYNNQVIFFGNLENHENAKEISSFCESQGFSVLSLDQGQLTDVGGAFILPHLNQ